MAGSKSCRLASSFIFTILSVCIASSQYAIAQTPSVTVAVIKSENVTPAVEFIGRLDPIQAVDVRARVSGALEQMQFSEGQDVKKGAPLFAIESAQYEASLELASSDVDSANATLANATLNLQRRQELFSKSAASQAEVDAAKAAFDTARAAVSAAQAQQKLAQLNLDYTQISSPLSGRIGKSNISQGNLVGPQSEVLARIVQLDPIRVMFSVSERDVISIREQFQHGPNGEINSDFLPTLRLANGETYDGKGELEFVGNEVDSSTGTVPVWVRFDNPKALLLPGGTVFVSLQPTKTKEVPVVPIRAVQQTSEGMQVIVVNADDVAEKRSIVAKTQVGQNWAVESGLNVGETVVIDGLQKIRPGMKVQPVHAQQPDVSQ